MYRIFIPIIIPIVLSSEGIQISPEIQKVLESVFANQRIDLQSEIMSLPNPYLKQEDVNRTVIESNATCCSIRLSYERKRRSLF